MVIPPAAASLRVRISAVSGKVRVTAEDRPDVVVDRGGWAEADRDGAVEVRAGRPSDSLEVRCPEGIDVVVGTKSGNVELAGRFGAVGVTSQSGSIKVAAATEADLRTVSGSVELDACEGRCRVSTTSGRITVGATGEAEISTVSAHVQVDAVARALQVRTVSGKVAIGSSAGGPVRASTVSGSITIRLPRDVRPAVRLAGLGKLKSSFEPGNDVAIDVASVSGTVKLVPA